MSQQSNDSTASFFEAVRKAYGLPAPDKEVIRSRKKTEMTKYARQSLQQSCWGIVTLFATAVALIGLVWCAAEIFSRWP